MRSEAGRAMSTSPPAASIFFQLRALLPASDFGPSSLTSRVCMRPRAGRQQMCPSSQHQGLVHLHSAACPEQRRHRHGEAEHTEKPIQDAEWRLLCCPLAHPVLLDTLALGVSYYIHHLAMPTRRCAVATPLGRNRQACPSPPWPLQMVSVWLTLAIVDGAVGRGSMVRCCQLVWLQQESPWSRH